LPRRARRAVAVRRRATQTSSDTVHGFFCASRAATKPMPLYNPYRDAPVIRGTCIGEPGAAIEGSCCRWSGSGHAGLSVGVHCSFSPCGASNRSQEEDLGVSFLVHLLCSCPGLPLVPLVVGGCPPAPVDSSCPFPSRAVAFSRPRNLAKRSSKREFESWWDQSDPLLPSSFLGDAPARALPPPSHHTHGTIPI
jgi:hypothetical protein